MPKLKSFSLSRLGVLVVLMIALALQAGTAFAADGDGLRTIIADRTGTDCASYNAAGNHSSVGVGIAFDGTNLLVSCYSDSTVTAVSPADGSQVSVHTIAGAGSLGALAWDGLNSQLWGCSNFSDVGIVDLTTDTFAPLFTSAGCFDGLAYDGMDDTIWASNDASGSTQHYSTIGALLGDFANGGLIGSCGNSGIAVGGSTLYLANNGCSEIYAVQKDFTSSSLFSSFPARLEDLECDSVTFAADGVGAIWSIDAYDNVLNAWEIPAGLCISGGGVEEPPVNGFMTGGGSVFTTAGTRVTHGFELNCDLSLPNSLEINWGEKKDKHKFHLESLDAALCSNDPGIDEGSPVAGFDTFVGSGTGRLDGVAGATVKFTFTDAGEPGVGDWADIKINGGAALDVAGFLDHGNQQAHPE